MRHGVAEISYSLEQSRILRNYTFKSTRREQREIGGFARVQRHFSLLRKMAKADRL